MRANRVLTGLTALVTAITGITAAAPAASAASLHGCPDLSLCFYFNSNFGGAFASYFYSDGDLADELFRWGGTNGRGVQVKNNAASVVNNAEWTATVYYNSGCNGSVASQSFGAHSGGNLFGDCASRDQD